MIVRENVKISEMTTMRLGGEARYVIDVEKREDLPEALKFAREKDLPIFVLGGGANTIGRDEGYRGVILRNKITGIFDNRLLCALPASEEDSEARDELLEERYIYAAGGEVWDDVVEYATNLGYTGIEALSKIPGLAGAAPVQNIGAYGQDISQVFGSAEVFDLSTGEFKTLHIDDMQFSYRKSILNTTERGRYFVISIELVLKEGEMERPFYNSIEKYIAEHNITDFSPASIREIVSKIRAEKLPDPKAMASAGSFFKNVYLSEAEAEKAEAEGLPVHHGKDGLKINSGYLIERAGLKGKVLHGFRVNEKAALVLINESAESHKDLAAARAEIVEAVKKDSGFLLEQEPVEIV